MDFIWKSIVVLTAGILLLRLSGRKSIAQLTIGTTIVMISIGTIIVQPIVEQSIWKAIMAAAIFVLTLIFIEYLQMKFNMIENFFQGKSMTIIENGKPVLKNLRKMRMTVDKMETQLRQKGIKNISDVKTATLEPNGRIGYELMPDQQPLTVGEFKRLMQMYTSTKHPNPYQQQKGNLFDEVRTNQHVNKNPENLQ